MLKRIATALATAIVLGGPAMAAPQGLDESHNHLYRALINQGVEFYINPNIACEDPESPDMDGGYFFAPQQQVPVLFVCQDNRTGQDGVEVAWTDNDLDTLRHEATHYLQDCIDGRANMSLTPFYDGPGGAPGTNTYQEVIELLGYENAFNIATWYRDHMDADNLVIRLEHEAFLVARDIEAGDIGETINHFCPVN